MRPPVAQTLRGFPRSLRVHYGIAPYGYKLSLPIPRRLPHRHLRRAYGVGALRSIVNPETSACFSEPPMRCCFVPSFNRTDATLRASFHPPIEDAAVNILTHSATFVYRLRRCFTPKGRGDFTPSADDKGMIVFPTRNVEIAVFTNTPSVSPLRPQPLQPRASLFTGHSSL